MASTSTRRRGSSLGAWSILVIVLLAAGVLWVGYAAGTGRMPDFLADLPFFGKLAHAKENERVQPPGTVAVPVAGRRIRSYSALQTEDLWDFERQELAVTFLSAERLPEGVLRDLGAIRGRVLREDHPAGYVFTDADFFPKGTRPGVAGGIPPGRRGLAVDARRIIGLDKLRQGDRFDIQVTLPLDASIENDIKGVGGIYGRATTVQMIASGSLQQSNVRTIVRNALIVQAAEVQAPPQLPGAPPVATARNLEVEAFVAVAPEEVKELNDMLAQEHAQLTCVALSGNPDDDPSVGTPGKGVEIPMGLPGSSNADFTYIESISGGKRELIAVPVADPVKK